MVKNPYLKCLMLGANKAYAYVYLDKNLKMYNKINKNNINNYKQLIL